MRLRLAAGLVAAGLAFALVGLTAGIGGGAETRPAAAPSETRAAADPGGGRAVFARMGCGSCHTLAAAGARGAIGPNLDRRLARHTRESLIERITRPPEPGGVFSMMPRNFGSRMDSHELDALVGFLLAAR